MQRVTTINDSSREISSSWILTPHNLIFKPRPLISNSEDPFVVILAIIDRGLGLTGKDKEKILHSDGNNGGDKTSFITQEPAIYF